MYTQALAYIESLKSAGIHPGLDTIRSLCFALGSPQDTLQVIHVAGTNGKGSTCAYCEGILRAMGKTTGLFSSPYVEDIREMIKLDGQMVSKELFSQGVFALKEMCEEKDIHPTEFEFLTALAFYLFAEQKVDVAIIEAGMGGALDATNVVARPAVCVLTHIDLDHAAFLGTTIEEIAKIKCGIIKPGSKVVCAPNPAVEHIICAAVAEQRAEVEMLAAEDVQNISVTLQGTIFTYKNQKFTAKMLGVHQAQNAVTAFLAVEALCGKVDAVLLQSGIQVALPARLEVLSTAPLVLLDGAHNPDGAQALADTLQALGLKSLTAVTAMMSDKDLPAILAQIAPFCKEIIATQVPNNPRSATAKALAELAGQYCPATAQPDCYAALELAKKQKTNNVLVFGSLYLAEALKNNPND